MVAQLGLVKVLGVPQNFCFTGTASDILQQIAASLAVQLPDTITNVVVGNSEPPDLQNTALWIRVDSGGAFLGLYVVSNGAWTLINGSLEFDPDPEGSSAMVLTDVDTRFARYTRFGDWVTFVFDSAFTVGGTPNDTVEFQLPIAAPALASNSAIVFATVANRDGTGAVPAKGQIRAGGFTAEVVATAGAFTAGTGRGIRVSGFYPLVV